MHFGVTQDEFGARSEAAADFAACPVWRGEYERVSKLEAAPPCYRDDSGELIHNPVLRIRVLEGAMPADALVFFPLYPDVAAAEYRGVLLYWGNAVERIWAKSPLRKYAWPATTTDGNRVLILGIHVSYSVADRLAGRIPAWYDIEAAETAFRRVLDAPTGLLTVTR